MLLYVNTYCFRELKMNRLLVLVFIITLFSCTQDDTSNAFSSATSVPESSKDTSTSLLISRPASNVPDAQEPSLPIIVEAPVVQQTSGLKLTWADKSDSGPIARVDTSRSVDIYAELVSSLPVRGDDLEKMFSISDPNVQHGLSEISKGRYTLVFNNISRGELCAREVEVSWSGNEVDPKFMGKQRFVIPSKGGKDLSPLKLESTEIFPEPGGSIELSFNRPLKKGQNLKHLITANYPFTSYEIKGKKVFLGLAFVRQSSIDITVYKEIQDECGISLASPATKAFSVEPLKPGVKFTGRGVILPDAEKIELPFQAVSAKSVTVTAFEVFDDNIGQFLQENKFDGVKSIERVGRYIWQKTVTLDSTSLRTWKDYKLDVSELMNQKKGSLIRLFLSIEGADSIFTCSDGSVFTNKKSLPESAEEFVHDRDHSSWDMFENNRSHSQHLNPCEDNYYERAADARSARNFIRSNVGLIVKQAANSSRLLVTATDLKTSEPLSAANIIFYNFQDQEIGRFYTDLNGFAEVSVQGVPFYLKAVSKGQIGYLKLAGINALTTSQFDIGGQKLLSNINGFAYGERDVWRPGDDIFLSFILQDKQNELPSNHPVLVDFFNPSGQLVSSMSNSSSTGSIYTFKLKTDETSPTGNWKAIFKVGANEFSKSIRVETVVPNRLKVEIDLPDDTRLQERKSLNVNLVSQWLHGAPASFLNAEVDVTLVPVKTSFKGIYPEYVFDDPAREYHSNKINVFEGKLSKDGEAGFELEVKSNVTPPGMLKAVFANKVFEEGGQFSINSFSVPFDFYSSYVGIQLPKGDAERGMLLTDIDHPAKIVVLDEKGKAVKGKEVEFSLYKLSWKWWYEKSSESLANYAQKKHHDKLSEGLVTTNEAGQAQWPLRVNYPDWGRYLVRACVKGDKQHCTGKVVYIDWPGWAGRQQETQGDNVDRLSVYSDKEKYSVGDTATISFPEMKTGKALVSIESANNILSHFWVDAATHQNFTFDITEAMTPNVYVSITYLQPHEDRNNDRPMRLMGIVPLLVEDPKSHLEPVITVVDEVKPQATFNIDVSESNQQAMNYTLAVVDDGLLGLTNYKTPNPFKYFYQRQALNVKTWDLYKDVVGAYSGNLQGLLPVGGSDSADDDDSGKTNRRFEPIVQFIGRFHLDAGATQTHSVTLPMYLGSVRAMVVAEDGYAYGKDEKSVTVRDEVSAFPSLPRVLRTKESANASIELFNNTKDERLVRVDLTVDEQFVVHNSGGQEVVIRPGASRVVDFPVKTKEALGRARFTFSVDVDGVKASQGISIEIKAPNSMVSMSKHYVVKPGKDKILDLTPTGIKGSTSATLGLSYFKPINLQKRLDYLIRYPHGCIEQTTSSVFPQLYLPQLTSLSSDQKQSVKHNITDAIIRLAAFQTFDGGFAYWPGQNKANAWGTNYAGHFLVLARQAGYEVPEHIISQWQTYQTTRSNISFNENDTRVLQEQSYRLYSLALSGAPNLSAMYRMKSTNMSDGVSLSLLALAYDAAGQSKVASELLLQQTTSVTDYSNSSTFGSVTRDKAVSLMALNAISDDRASQVAINIADSLASDNWHSTQTTAYALLALANYLQSSNATHNMGSVLIKDEANSKIQVGNKTIRYSVKQNLDKPQSLTVENEGTSDLQLTLTESSIPKQGLEKSYSNGVSLSVQYVDNDGNAIDVTKLRYGSDITLVVNAKSSLKRTVDNLALTYLVPSGWQIYSEREVCTTTACTFDYIDIKDDLAHAYFSLKPNEEKVLRLNINASFVGNFYHPAVLIEAMYDNEIKALEKGYWVEVVK